MKSEVSQYRTFNSKFLEQFYSINKEYAEKIKTKIFCPKTRARNIMKKLNILHQKSCMVAQ